MRRCRPNAAPRSASPTTWCASRSVSSTSTTCAPTSRTHWHEHATRRLAPAVAMAAGGARPDGRPARASRLDDAGLDGHPTALPALGDRSVLDHHHDGDLDPGDRPAVQPPARSEEHTSELQSRENLVCRLLLEKKKKIDKRNFLKKKKIKNTVIQKK